MTVGSTITVGAVGGQRGASDGGAGRAAEPARRAAGAGGPGHARHSSSASGSRERCSLWRTSVPAVFGLPVQLLPHPQRTGGRHANPRRTADRRDDPRPVREATRAALVSASMEAGSDIPPRRSRRSGLQGWPR